MNRRAFIGALSGIGLGIGSGCLGEGDEPATSAGDNSAVNHTGDSPARQNVENGSSFDDGSTQETVEEIKAEEATLELRETHVESKRVEYADEFSISATIANVGSEPIRVNSLASAPEFAINYVESDRIFENHSQGAAGDIELDSGAITQISLGPFDAAVTGAWKVSARDYLDIVQEGAETTFEIHPQRPSVSQSVPLLHGVSMTVDDFHLYEMIFADYLPGGRTDTAPAVGLETPPDGQLFAAAEVTVTNDEQEYLTVASTPELFQLASSQFSLRPTESYGFAKFVPPGNVRLPGDPFDSIRLSAGESQTAWLLGTVDIVRRDEIRLTFDKWPNTGPSEAIIDSEEGTYSSFELIRPIAPGTWEDGDQRFGAIVRNIGDSAGTFRGLVQYEDSETGEFLDPPRGKELERSLAIGETAALTTQYNHRKGSRYRIQPFGVTLSL